MFDYEVIAKPPGHKPVIETIPADNLSEAIEKLRRRLIDRRTAHGIYAGVKLENLKISARRK